jgi:hypothetical protein
MNERKYSISKEGWIFNLEATNAELAKIKYSILDGEITLPITIAGTKINDYEDIEAMIEECLNLEWAAKVYRKVTSREYQRIKELVNWYKYILKA